VSATDGSLDTNSGLTPRRAVRQQRPDRAGRCPSRSGRLSHYPAAPRLL